eukprot:1879780-Rhodomonas_salina.1
MSVHTSRSYVITASRRYVRPHIAMSVHAHIELCQSTHRIPGAERVPETLEEVLAQQQVRVLRASARSGCKFAEEEEDAEEEGG